MRDAQSKFLDRILQPEGEGTKSYGKERQLTAQALSLHVERRDGRHAEGFAWSHYVGYRWIDEGEREKLIVLFAARVLEIEGHNLKVLVGEIREGQLNSVRELASAQAALKQANAEDEPIISSVKMYPDFDELLKEMKGEDREAGHTGRVRGR